MANEASTRSADSRLLLWAGEVARLLLGFGVLVLLTRSVQPEVLGAYLSVTSLALLAPRLLDAGLPHALGYFLRVEPASMRAGARMLARHVALALPIALLAAFCLRFMPFANEQAHLLVTEHWGRLALFMVSELAILLGLGSYIPTGRFKAYLVTVLVSPLLFMACLLLWPGEAPTSGQLLDILLVTSVAGSLAAAATLAYSVRHTGHAAFPVGAAYGYGLRSYGSALSKIAAQRFDRLFLVTVLGAAGYAQYSLAISVRDVAIFPANLYATTLRNRQIDLVTHAGDIAQARRLLFKVTAIWLALGLAGATLFWPLWPHLIGMAFGERYAESADFLKIVSFSCAPMATMGFAWNHLYAMKLPGRVTILTCASLLMALPIFLLFIKLHGPSTGVALAVVAWSTLTAILSLAWASTSRPGPAASTHP